MVTMDPVMEFINYCGLVSELRPTSSAKTKQIGNVYKGKQIKKTGFINHFSRLFQLKSALGCSQQIRRAI